ncbi:MAG: response regulator [Ktedonobacterales bacterium]
MPQQMLDPERTDALAGMPGLAPRPTVLVVDDEPSIVELIAEVLQNTGYRVLLARDGRAALALARREHPALVLTDRDMPEIDGNGLAQRLRAGATTRNIPVVIMSSTHSTTDDTLHIPFLAKPFDLDDMLATVAEYVGPGDTR